MKILYLKRFFLLLSLVLLLSTEGKSYFYHEPISKNLGNKTNLDVISFTIYVKNLATYPDGNDFHVEIDDPVNIFDWMTISPSSFTLTNEGHSQNITFSGTLPSDWGSNALSQLTINITDNDSYGYSIVYWTYYSSAGVGDYLLLSSFFTDFDEQEQLFCSADFYDFDPVQGDPDYMISWNMTMKVFSNEGEYEYVSIDQTCCSSYADWYFTAPNLPTSLSFFRNEDGQVFGECIISGHDNDGYYHEVNFPFNINKEPETPTIYILPIDENSIKLYVLGFGCKNFQVFYDTDTGEPYNGTGLLQGNSPIIFENSTIIQLDGLEECTEYFFAVKAFNNMVVSDFSDEKSIVVFDVPNSLPINYNFGDISISDNFNLDDNQYFMGNLIIESGAEVELTGGIMFFEENSKIIIEPGGKLTLDGATCTGVCGQTWQGIEVWGNSTASQATIGGVKAQGWLVMENEAVIENAIAAVELWKPGDYSKTGGIVQATDAHFFNNRNSVHANNYRNFDPNFPEREMDNVSYFTDCEFELNGEYIPTQTFYKHVDLYRVKGIQFRGCDFSVTPVEGVSTWNSAIASNSAGFTVSAICTSNTTPCSAWDKCTFNGFKIAIHASNSLSNNYTFSVMRAEFTDNICGVQVEDVNNYSVLFSDFFIGHNAVDDEECEGQDLYAAGYGINSTNASFFGIEENYFTKAQGAPAGIYVGIYIAETQSTDQVYLNSFENLSYANYTEGQNWSENGTWEGLAFYCNQNTGNYADFYVADGYNSGIQSLQGDENHVAGNTFSPTGATWHFYNGGTFLVGYYYCAYCPGEDPDIRKIYHVMKQGEDLANSCLSHHGGTSGDMEDGGLVLTEEQKLETGQLYASSLSGYNNVKTLYDNLKDGGNTDALKDEVENAWPEEMWALREELLGKSPHLSLEVLKMAADKTDVLPDAVLFEILAANPDELKKEELLAYLEDKENPLPGYMVEILRQVAGGTNYKTVLEQQMAGYNQAKTRAAYDMIRSNLNDAMADPDELRNWLDNVGGRRADEQIIASYMQQNNFGDALTLAGILPQLYNYDERDLAEHSLFMDMLNLEIQLRQQGRDISQLDSAEVSNLLNIASTSRCTAGSMARGILETQYGYHFCNCLNTGGNEGFKSSPTGNPKAFAVMFGGSIVVNPNPARDWTAFEYTLPGSKTEGIIKITDVTGNNIQMFTVSGEQGSKIWDTRKIKPGVYFYEFVVNGYSKTGKIIVNN